MNVAVDTSQHWAVSWTIDETMERSSHALVDDGQVWLIDPVAYEPALAAAEDRGTVQGVLQLLDRHPRDCEALAERYGVPHLRLPDAVPGAPFEVFRMVWKPRWRELALWWPARKALVVAESAGTGGYFALAGKPAGIHPFLRLLPPGALRAHEPEHLLPGHGPALHGEAASALKQALARSRKDIPRVLPAIISAGRRPR